MRPLDGAFGSGTRSASNGTKSPLSQYASKTADIFATTSGLRTPDTRTFHSSPVTCAECVRFDDPMYAVEYPLSRWNSQAFAWRRVDVVSYDTRTSAPSAASSSSARSSVLLV